ncbi:MAG: hypothetical protein Ct9H90mP20_7030 [Candidatus Neomarinimicrobiota bacterium]|nr:MAG: hypothetical protein Ct9H90mP20_7030 [Candidatus Neomarinimicrobiota bacterium]
MELYRLSSQSVPIISLNFFVGSESADILKISLPIRSVIVRYAMGDNSST